MRKLLRRRWATVADESGQTLVFSIIMLAVCFGFAAIVIDGGDYLLVRRNMQGNADAAALAAARDLIDSQAQATATVNDYVTSKNSIDGASVDQIQFLSNSRMKVTVKREEEGQFLQFFGMDAPTIRASATVQIRTMGARAGMLPLAFMRDSYTLGQNAEIKTAASGTSNRGAVSPDNSPPTCNTSNGANDFRNMIMGEANGGIDACAHPIGDMIDTKPGNMSGPTRQGFDGLIGGSCGGACANTDSFDDVFELDDATGKYVVKLPNSPRLGMVPIIQNDTGGNTWPNGNKQVEIVQYMLVYIGKTDEPPNYPAWTDNGKSVWVTPVQTFMPASWDPDSFIDFDEDNDAPTVVSLVE